MKIKRYYVIRSPSFEIVEECLSILAAWSICESLNLKNRTANKLGATTDVYYVVGVER